MSNKYDPEYSIWDAVAKLELAGYTRAEIRSALKSVDRQLIE